MYPKLMAVLISLSLLYDFAMSHKSIVFFIAIAYLSLTPNISYLTIIYENPVFRCPNFFIIK